jgi:hypothetical protein
MTTKKYNEKDWPALSGRGLETVRLSASHRTAVK